MNRSKQILAERIYALPAEQQALAVACLQQMVAERQVKTMSAVTVDKLLKHVDFSPDRWQLEVLRSQSDRILLNCSRQTGKSTVSAALAVHAASSPHSLILLLSPSLRQSQELFKKTLKFHHEADLLSSRNESSLRLELANGSRIISLPGTESTVRGFSNVTLLVIDEAARVDDALYYSLRPMLAVSRGRLVALSTPFGSRGWWYDAWRSSEPWERYEIQAEQCPRISKDFLREERNAMGEHWYGQEYECRFIDSQLQAFTTEDIENAFSEEVHAWEI